MDSINNYRVNEPYGYMPGQEDNWYMMNGRTPYNTNYAPVNFNLEDLLTHSRLLGEPVAFTKQTIYSIDNNTLAAVDLNSLRTKWRFTTDKPSPYMNPRNTVLKDNWIYTVVSDTLYALEDLGESYKLHWSTNFVEFFPAFITFDNNNLYTQQYKAETWKTPEERKITAYNLKTGEKSWEILPANGLNLNILAGRTKLFLLGQHVDTKNLELTAHNPSTGQLDWMYTINVKNIPMQLGKPVYFDDIVYFATEEIGLSPSKSFIYAINAADGTLLWKHTTIGSRPDVNAPMSISSTILVYKRDQNHLVALNRSTGEVLWQRNFYETGNADMNRGRLLLSNQNIFLDYNKKIMVFDIKTGALVKEWVIFQVLPSLSDVVPIMLNSDRMIAQVSDGFVSLTPKAPEQKQYIVKPGDTLYKIATIYKTSIYHLASLNNLAPPYALMVGQKLNVPDLSKTPVEHVVRPGDTLYKIAVMYNTTVQDIIKINYFVNPNSLQIGMVLKIPGSLMHTVKAGETLWLISMKYGVPISEIIAKNNIPSSGMIYIGQNLIIK